MSDVDWRSDLTDMFYNQLEEPLKLIHKRFVSLDEGEVNKTKPLVRKTLSKLVSYMKEDAIFMQLFGGLYYGGSFYHNLKVQKPDEFDIDFLLVLPKCEICKIRNCKCIEITPGQIPGFLYFKMNKTFCALLYKKFCRNGYVRSDLVYNWMKSLIYKALNQFNKDNGNFSSDELLADTKVTLYTECPPALKICIKKKTRLIYIDLASAFKLEQIYWPHVHAGFKANSTKKDYFSIVPFSPKGFNNYWRPTFQEQEKEIILGKERLKPALRLLKIMKMNLNHKVSSYILKTLILEEADKYEWKHKSLACTFMILLIKYRDCLQKKRVQYYWNNNVNLLDCIKEETLVNHGNEVNNLYLKLQYEYEANPTVVAQIILKRSSDYNKFNTEWNIFKKPDVQIFNYYQTGVKKRYFSQNRSRACNLQTLIIDTLSILENCSALKRLR